MNNSTPSQNPSVQLAEWWKIFGNRGIEYLPAHLFDLTEEEVEDVSAHQAVPARVWGYSMHNSIYNIERIEGWGVLVEDEWSVFATEQLAQNFVSGLDGGD